MASQVKNGKAFEYALIQESFNILSGSGHRVLIVQDDNYSACMGYYDSFNPRSQLKYDQAAIAAINHIVLLEPRLVNAINADDTLTLQLQPDSAGQEGDVRDILFIRSSQNWEIGISAKNNHTALKHSRLSKIKNFGLSWVRITCSQNYFDEITPIFDNLYELKVQGRYWRDLQNKHVSFYQPILNAFRNELLRISEENANIPQNLVTYLVGSNDFYKVIKRNRIVEVLAFNIHNTLGSPINGIRPVGNVRRLVLPTQIVRMEMMPGKTDTLSMICDQGWQISFRIHSAESLVSPSLKFDINLVGNPATMYSHHIPY